jgi:hypothetical protein
MPKWCKLWDELTYYNNSKRLLDLRRVEISPPFSVKYAFYSSPCMNNAFIWTWIVDRFIAFVSKEEHFAIKILFLENQKKWQKR